MAYEKDRQKQKNMIKLKLVINLILPVLLIFKSKNFISKISKQNFKNKKFKTGRRKNNFNIL